MKTEIYQPLLPWMGTKLMLMSSMLVTNMCAMALSLCLDQTDGLWEVACSPHSWLSEASSRQGIQSRRINLAEGYDL